MADIQLKLINQSNDVNNSQIVVFQQNASTNAIAWLVIKNLGIGDYHPFVYPTAFEVGAKDADGNYTPSLPCTDGQAFEMVMSHSGHVLQLSSAPSSNPTEVEILNNLPSGSIDALCFKDGKLMASTANVSPGMKAIFQFKPTIFIGVASELVQGQEINPNIMVQSLTELDLLGISSADIVMTGGGAGPAATPFAFEMTNIA